MLIPKAEGTDDRFPEYEAALKEIQSLKDQLKKQAEDYQKAHVELSALRNLSNRYLNIIEKLAGGNQ